MYPASWLELFQSLPYPKLHIVSQLYHITKQLRSLARATLAQPIKMFKIMNVCLPQR
jgi:hypothetical protein